MWNFIIKTLAYIRIRFFSIGYKKRIAIQLLLLLFVALASVTLWPYFFTNLAELEIFRDLNKRGNLTGAGWDRWSSERESRGYRSIGDVYDHCDSSTPRTKVGKVLIHYDKSLGTVVATIAANFTMPVSVNHGTVQVIAQFHGRTLFDQKYNLCKTKVDSFRCPLQKGQLMLIFETFKLPKYIPKGRYNSFAKVSNQENICFIAAESNLKV